MIKRGKLRSGLLVCVMYIYLFNPTFMMLGIGSIKILLILALVFSLISRNTFSLLLKFRKEAILSLVVVLFALFSSVRSDLSLFQFSYLHTVWFLESIFLPIVIIQWFSKTYYHQDWDRSVIYAGLLASLITIVLINAPSLNDFVRNTLIDYSAKNAKEYYNVRGYGIAEGLIGSYGPLQGMILAICIYRVRDQVLYAIPILPLIVSIAFNARTGLLAIPISIGVLAVRGKFNIKVVITLLILLSASLYFYTSDVGIVSSNQLTKKWIEAGYGELVANVQGDLTVGATKYLIYDQKFVPKNAYQTLFGTGNLGPGTNRVDNGYYYILWFGGYSLLAFLLFYYRYLFLKVFKYDATRYFSVVLFLLLLVNTLKWNYLLMPNGLSRLLGYYYVFTIIKTQVWTFNK